MKAPTTKKKATRQRPSHPTPKTIAARFLQACQAIISRKENGIKNYATLAKDLDTYKNLFTKINNPDYKAGIPMHLIVKLGERYNIDMNWLLLNIGEMERTGDDAKIDALMEKIAGRLLAK